MKVMGFYGTALVMLVCYTIGYFGGRIDGASHPGQTLVPTKGGPASSLPRWACREIVDLRVQKLQLFRQMVKAYSDPKDPPPELILFKTGNRKDCK